MAILTAIAAQFVAEHYGAPAMLMAILFGIALNFLSEPEKTAISISLSAPTILRFGVAILAARVSTEMVMALGWGFVGVLVGGIVATILFGVLIARVLGQGHRFAILTAVVLPLIRTSRSSSSIIC